MYGFKKFINSFRNNNDEYVDMNSPKFQSDYKAAEKYNNKYHSITNRNVGDHQVGSVSRYLSSSKPVDDFYLGKNKDTQAKQDAAHLEDIVRKTRTPNNMYLYRGFSPSKDINVGDEITHHGITSYGSRPNFAEMYGDDGDHVIRLKVPKNTRAAYIENIAQQRKFKYDGEMMKGLIRNGGEGNWILHPKSKIKITRSYKKSNKMYHEAELVHDGVSD